MKYIRNFSIIAHIDHGKSTFSDQLIEICGGLSKREMTTQILDSMDIERERGITIKAQSVTLNYHSKNGKKYQLNFIDTPGHVDFSYEVSRSLAACEGALLLVDASQGVEAQTQANCYTAIEMNLEVLPVLNKIDLPSADPIRVKKEIENIIGLSTSNLVQCSSKTGIGIINVLEQLICVIPAPKGNINAPLQALIIDSWFDNYLGIVSLICIKNGFLKKGEKIKVMSTGSTYIVERLGIFTPKRIEREILHCGEVGWITCAIKDILGAKVGDTITSLYNKASFSLPNFQKVKPQPQVYVGLFPANSKDYQSFRDSLGKLSLNDSSIFYEPESSDILGFGFRCGFLGLLHMEIIQERLFREYGLELIRTAPTVVYKVITKKNQTLYIDNPSKFPDMHHILELSEPIAECNILSPKKCLGSIIQLCISKRGIQKNIMYYGNMISITWHIPMIEVVFDFFDKIKSQSHGYASLNYTFKKFSISNMVRVDIIINGTRIDALTLVMHQSYSSYRSRQLVEKIKHFIPRQQFDIVIQAAIGKNIIAKSIVKQVRKDVLSRCSGGDISRKKKLLKKQKVGKKKMKRIGNIFIAQEVFFSILQIKNS